MNNKKDNVICHVGLGGNLGDSWAYLNNAVKALRSSKEIHSLRVSPFYRSKPHGPQDQPDYLNAVVAFETALEAEQLLDLLQQIETDNQRVREGAERWGARTLDLDLLFYGDKKINTRRLSVPHPRICERPFVLLPLADLLGAATRRLKINHDVAIKDCIDQLTMQQRRDTIRLKSPGIHE